MFDLADLGHILLLEFRPDRARHIQAGGRRAFLSLEFECAADGCRDQGIDVGGIVGEDEVLAAGLANDAGIIFLLVNRIADGLPHALEHGCGTGKMDARQIGAGHHRITHLPAGTGNEIDDAIRHTCLLQ